jgi:hypothetical protein
MMPYLVCGAVGLIVGIVGTLLTLALLPPPFPKNVDEEEEAEEKE